ncbi:MAG TPA: hypothetical protein VGR25_02770 [bacterium]|nr:hypothetical protein [bacterium]
MSNLSYDVLTVLHNKLEAVSIYDRYIQDSQQAGDEKCRSLFEDIKREDDRHIERLRGELERLVKEGKFR